MNILMTADTIGGVWTYTIDLCQQLCKNNVRVHLFTMGRSLSENQRQAVDAIEGLSITPTAHRLEWMENPWADVEAAGQELLQVAAQFKPDLVHLNNYAHSTLPWQCPVVVVGHSCVDTWFRAVLDQPSGNEWLWYRQVVTQGIQHADALVTPTQCFGMQLMESYGRHPFTMTIHNGRNASCMCTDDTTRREASVIGLGRLWDKAKNLKALDAAAAQVGCPVRIAGATCGPDGGEVHADHAQLLGELAPTEVQKELKNAAIFASPALYEPFGLAALEAAQAGCALVLSDLPTLREVWEEAAVYVPPNCPDELAAAINSLHEQPQLLHELQQRASRRARRYTAARMAQQYLELYQQLIHTYVAKERNTHAHRALLPLAGQ